MGLHPSLKDSNRLAAKRAVLKRGERIKWLMEKGKWQEDRSALGLPKIKIVKIKMSSKAKKEEKEEDKKQEKPASK
jgi:small basic protein (TIGR04137 family)